ncbi:DUF3108 domain-containing protein [Thiothrix fructosivorans]|uniref:DUF3108 domain-containing protein n=1 Tax=Thiothrix fructosivorans TaxID=111770 RepID=A0A8B0SKV0_9GAMM|nr:DUF3108 domain-containing protein [Thiothrix fructosivorans]MBO0613055.1 DUF3108 domain-containing protein [Thiothrix fructosivorans]QTX11499.1 DUF3108 domain-containing protein [Thiothrix fructosivorans]
MQRFIIAAGLTLFTSLAVAAPDAFQASYTVTAKGLEMGVMTTSLRYNGNTYTYQKRTEANGLAALLSGDTLTERSTGKKNGEELIPAQYMHHHKNKKKDKKDEFSFVTPTQTSGTFNGTAYQLTVPDGTLDMATLELYLMDALAAGKPLNYHIVSRGKLQDYRLRNVGKETISVPAGEYDCEKVEVVHTDGERQTILWLAPKLNYAIVQVRHKEDGDTIETRLKQYQ